MTLVLEVLLKDSRKYRDFIFFTARDLSALPQTLVGCAQPRRGPRLLGPAGAFGVGIGKES